MKNVLIALVMAVVLSWLPSTAHAQSGIAEKLNQSLDAMVNYTPPSIQSTNRRTVITGGSLTVKVQTGGVEGFSFRPPSISVGCGGIDAFFGAFSMISKEVLVQALRSIVTGALQYAFRIALKVLCQSCEQIMADVSQMLAQANRSLLDMCNTTNNFLESKLSSDDAAANIRTSMGLQNQGQCEDSAACKGWGDFKSSWQKFFEFNEDKVDESIPEYGNHLYKALKKAEDGTFYWMGEKHAFYEEMVSLIGTVVLCSPAEDTCPQVASSPNVIVAKQEGEAISTTYLPVLRFEYLVTGNTSTIDSDGVEAPPSVWRCNTHAGDRPCLAMNPGTLDGFVSMSQRMRNAFLGTGSNPGIIHKLRYDRAAALTEEEERWMRAGGPIVGMVIDLATMEEDSARGWIMDYSDVLAADFTFAMMNEFMTKTRQAMARQSSDTMKEQLELIQKAFDNAHADYMKISQLAESRSVPFEAYQARALALSRRRY